SVGLYNLYWFYVTRKAVDEELGDERALKQTPGLQLFGPIGLGIIGALLSIVLIGIPILIAAGILAIVVYYYLLKDISALRVKAGLPGFPAVWFVLGPIIAGVVLAFIPPLNLLASLAAFVIYGIVVNKLNEYWDKKTSGAATSAQFTGGEAGVVVGGLVLGIIQAVAFAAAIAAYVGFAEKEGEVNDLQQQLEREYPELYQE
ncbi:MAG: DUF4234 domain-containing protein, partial [bacterium]|nr:DUF4234 domain-containing protein [bacterium]